MEKSSWDFSRCHERMLAPFGGALPIFPMTDKRHTATDYIDWWKRYTIRAPLFGG
jgi:hypothetical protein